jgi:hypothetical protein
MRRNIDLWIKLFLRHLDRNKTHGNIFFAGISIAFITGSIIIAIFAGSAIIEIINKLL